MALMRLKAATSSTTDEKHDDECELSEAPGITYTINTCNLIYLLLWH